MIENDDISEVINKKIEDIRNKVFSGEISLLNLELEPIFIDLKESLSVYNIFGHSKIYKEACKLLSQKFEDLKNLLSSMDNEKDFFNYIKLNPSDIDIYHLFEGCWIKFFTIDALSTKYMESCSKSLSGREKSPVNIEHLNKESFEGDFLLEISMQQYSKKIMDFFNEIKEKLPCKFEEIFEHEEDQFKIYDNFIYLLHLIQSGLIKYQKETNYLYS